MALSGSYDESYNVLEVVTEALQLIGVYDASDSLLAADTSTVKSSLFMMLKGWQKDGIGIWKNTPIAIFQSYEGYTYNIGPSQDHATSSYVKTEVATAAGAGDATLVVDSITGISDGDAVGIELDDGTLQWTTVNGDPADATITLTAVLTDSAAVDNHVYTYTTMIQKPVSLVEMRLHNPDDTERPLTIVSKEEYLNLSDKTATGTANMVQYEELLTYGTLNVYPACSDVQYILLGTVRHPINDLDALTNDVDFPVEYTEAMAYNLAIRIAPKFRVPVPNEVLMIAASSYAMLKANDNSMESVFFNFTGR